MLESQTGRKKVIYLKELAADAPFGTADQLSAFEQKLADPSLTAQLINYFVSIGGRTSTSLVYTALKELGTLELWSQFSWKGSGGAKKAFCGSPLIRVLSCAARKAFVQTKALDINEDIKEFLKSAPAKLKRAMNKVSLYSLKPNFTKKMLFKIALINILPCNRSHSVHSFRSIFKNL